MEQTAQQKEPIIVKILRILLGCLFIFSGLSKAIDPIANAYQFGDYFHSFHMDFFQIFDLFLAYALTIAEFALGVMMLCRIKMRFTTIVYLLFMGFFFCLTAWLALGEYLELHHGYDFGIVKDCGCFGKVIKLSNLGTFLKNVGLLALAIIVFIFRKRIPDINLKSIGQWGIVAVSVVACFFLQFYCQRHLPIFDLSDWKIGENAARDFIDRPEVTETVYVYKDSTGTEFRMTEDEMMAKYEEDPAFFDGKGDPETEVKVISKIQHAPIQGFTMWTEPDSDGQFSDLSSDLIDSTNSTPLFIVFMDRLDKTSTEAFQKQAWKDIVKCCEQNNYELVGLTNSSNEEIATFAQKNNINFPIYRSDCDPVKGPFIVRDAIHANPGIIYIQNGIVQGKWAWRDFGKVTKGLKK